MNWFLGAILIFAHSVHCDPVWRWECSKGYCQKFRVTPDTRDSALSLPACRLFCSAHAALWPQPTGKIDIGNYLVRLNINSIDVSTPRSDSPAAALVRGAGKRFKELIEKQSPRNGRQAGGRSLFVTLIISDPAITKLTLDTDESYTLRVGQLSDGRINATVAAQNYFGGRHGLETLSQLVIYDDLRNEVQIVRDVHITDKPAYPYRGILLDTARNYMSVDSIKRTIDGMAASKLNTFHWHITDSHSFPYVSKSQPRLSELGAYSPSKVYTREDVAEIVKFGKERGVRVMPEFDAPAHVGEGWQDTDFVACFNKKPWQAYCVEPPCGQLDPTKFELYDVLEDIYQDMVEQFDPDIFHMGGDEVSLSCWNSTENIVQWMNSTKNWGREEEDFVKLWDVFQSKALERFVKQSGPDIPIIMWTSTLTKKEYVETFLPKDKYIIQIWTTGSDDMVKDLLERDYRLILSNYDALYLDCGFGGWVTDGNNWCSPYIGWQKVYENSPSAIAGNRTSQMLGAEATFWSEQADDTSLDSRLWPRAAAMAERLWSEPSTSWKVAEQRMLIHRERLVHRGIAADALEPQWCIQNEANCPNDGDFNVANDI